MKKTPLYQRHVDLGARMVEYAGWNMPVQYAGISNEILAVRNKVGMFDVSHMGEIRVCGEGAGEYLNWLLTRRVTGKKPDQITYAILCADDGGTVDDLLVYTLGEEDYLLVVNAANKDKDVVHLETSLPVYGEKYPNRDTSDIKIIDESDLYGQIAVQGPESLDVLLGLSEKLGLTEEQRAQLEGLRRFRDMTVPIEGEELPMIISRTGAKRILPAVARADMTTMGKICRGFGRDFSKLIKNGTLATIAAVNVKRAVCLISKYAHRIMKTGNRISVETSRIIPMLTERLSEIMSTLLRIDYEHGCPFFHCRDGIYDSARHAEDVGRVERVISKER
jgi:hypothetical protein